MNTPSNEPATFSLLWQMVNTIDEQRHDSHADATGTIIGRYASVIDDRIENSGHSRSTLSLKLYTTEQLKEELGGRDDTN